MLLPAKPIVIYFDYPRKGPKGLDAFSIVLTHAGSSEWYTSTLNLQLASLQLCVLCRSVSRLRMAVSNVVPFRVCKDVPARSTRIPALRLRQLTWRLPEWEIT